MEIQDLEKKLNSIKTRIQETREKIEDAEKRKAMATQKLESFQVKYEDARNERQDLLAASKDIKEVNDIIRGLQTDRELAEDEVAGLDKLLIDLKEVAGKLALEEKESAEDIKKARLEELAREYNKIAAKLAPVVKEIWGLRYELRQTLAEPDTIIVPWGWEKNALETIPKLYTSNDEHPSQYTAAAVFFDLGIFKRQG